MKERLHSFCRKQNKLISFAFSAVGMLAACIVVIVALVMIENRSAAWFVSNKDVNGSGMKIVSENENLVFDDAVIVKKGINDRVLEISEYKRDTDGYYYKYADNNYVISSDTGEKIPLHFSELIPGGYIDITVSYTEIGNKSLDYKLSISDFDSTEGMFEVHGKEHSVLGIYRLALLSDTGESSLGWLATYNDSGDDTVNDPMIVKSGKINVGETQTTTFRLYIDLEQYNRLSGITANLLSEKEMRIGRIALDVMWGDQNK